LCWSCIPVAALRLLDCDERCGELAPRRSSARLPARLAKEKRRGHRAGSLMRIVHLTTLKSGP
jgi:hypothetical protein